MQKGTPAEVLNSFAKAEETLINLAACHIYFGEQGIQSTKDKKKFLDPSKTTCEDKLVDGRETVDYAKCKIAQRDCVKMNFKQNAIAGDKEFEKEKVSETSMMVKDELCKAYLARRDPRLRGEILASQSFSKDEDLLVKPSLESLKAQDQFYPKDAQELLKADCNFVKPLFKEESQREATLRCLVAQDQCQHTVALDLSTMLL